MQSVVSADNRGSSSLLACRQTVTQSVRGREGSDGGGERAKDNKLRLSVDLKKQKDEPQCTLRKQTPGFVSVYKYHSPLLPTILFAGSLFFLFQTPII